MKITQLSVNGLFGLFNHSIPLDKSGDVTIVIGENGIGKTKILEAINALFDKKFLYLCDLEFQSIRIEFDSKDQWELTKKNEKDATTLFLARAQNGRDISKAKPDRLFVRRNAFAQNFHKLITRSAIASKWWTADANVLNPDDADMLLARNLAFLQVQGKQSDVGPPAWFIEVTEKIAVRLIETQRILSLKGGKTEAYVSTVETCSSQLKELISQAIRLSADITSALDSTYPNRLVERLTQRGELVTTYSQLNTELLSLDERRKELSAAGLVVDAQNTDLATIEDNKNELIFVLMKLYIADSYQKLEPYKELAEKISLFMKIINKRFKHKQLEISKEKGFVFRSNRIMTDSGFAEIDAKDLSSGEQHELVLFYKLMFNSAPDDLVLIDEPELSLHISWQNQFINDLKEVASLNRFAALIATHSPDIISENWDLRVELLGAE